LLGPFAIIDGTSTATRSTASRAAELMDSTRNGRPGNRAPASRSADFCTPCARSHALKAHPLPRPLSDLLAGSHGLLRVSSATPSKILFGTHPETHTRLNGSAPDL
jgi:hypothetical protein